MDMISVILESMEEILGLEQSEMKSMLDVNLIEEGLVDSLSIMTLISTIEEKVGYPIDIRQMSPLDLSTINRLAKAVEVQA